jgi:hypothetical protein
VSTRITLRIGNTTPDDLEIQRFLRMLGQKNLSRQSWIKHAMILGFAQLEKEIGSADTRDGGRQSPRKTAQNTHGQQNPGAQEVSGEQQMENGVEPNHNRALTPPVQTHSPQPVPVSSTPAHPAPPPAGVQSPAGTPALGRTQPHAEVQSTPFLQPQPQPVLTSSVDRFTAPSSNPTGTAAPEASGKMETILPAAVLQTASLPAVSLPGSALLTEEELRFSSTAVEQARKLMGSFGKGYDG